MSDLLYLGKIVATVAAVAVFLAICAMSWAAFGASKEPENLHQTAELWGAGALLIVLGLVWLAICLLGAPFIYRLHL